MAGKTQGKSFPAIPHSHSTQGLGQATNQPRWAELRGVLREVWGDGGVRGWENRGDRVFLPKRKTVLCYRDPKFRVFFSKRKIVLYYRHPKLRVFFPQRRMIAAAIPNSVFFPKGKIKRLFFPKGKI